MRGRRVLDLTEAQVSVRSSRGALLIDETRVPLEDVGVVLLGSRTSISGGALTMLANYGVVLLNCDWRGIPNMTAYGWSDNSRVAARHKAQAELSPVRRKQAWKEIVKAKIRGQANNLEAISSPASKRLKVLTKEVKSGDSSNSEAQAARIYWRHFFPEPSFKRIPGSPDQLNSLLNYGYTVLRGFVIQAISSAGLWPSYGLWHRNRSNTFVLADDLIEPFRPALDFAVRDLPEGATLDMPEVKQTLVAVSSSPMQANGSSVVTAINDFASNLAMFCEGELDKVSPPVWDPIKTEPVIDFFMLE